MDCDKTSANWTSTNYYGLDVGLIDSAERRKELKAEGIECDIDWDEGNYQVNDLLQQKLKNRGNDIEVYLRPDVIPPVENGSEFFA